MKVDAPGSAREADRGVGAEGLVARGQVERDVVAIDRRAAGALAGFVTGEVLAGHSALLRCR